MADILEQINEYKREEIARKRAERSLTSLEGDAGDRGPTRGFRDALVRAGDEGGIALIAEIKKASPSKGLIRADFHPARLAEAYAEGGAACLSVLTDAPSFQGAPEHLEQARGAVPLPALRKDFMLDPYQVVEARAWGADCILVIMASVSDGQGQELAAAAREWGMDVIAEVHDDAELARAVEIPKALIGINNRNLKTFETRLETTERLAPQVADSRLVVAESGINSRDDIERLTGAGAHAFLVGESLMREDDVRAATARLLGLDSARGEAAE